MSAVRKLSHDLALAEVMAGRQKPPDAATQALQRYLSKPTSSRFTALFPYLRRPVHFGVARAILPVRPVVALSQEDLEQDVFLHLLDHNARILRQFRPKKGPLRSYVRIVAYNKAVDRLRRCDQWPSFDGDVNTAVLSRVVDCVEHRDTFCKLVHHLETTAHNGGPQAVLQALIQGETLRNVAQQTGLSAKYLDKCASELRKRARDWRTAQNSVASSSDQLSSGPSTPEDANSPSQT